MDNLDEGIIPTSYTSSMVEFKKEDITLFANYITNDYAGGYAVDHFFLKENYGFINHYLHIDNMKDRMYGTHIHDCAYPEGDHCPPGEGDLDFAQLKELILPTHLKVLEMNPRVEAEALKKGFIYIKSVWGEE